MLDHCGHPADAGYTSDGEAGPRPQYTADCHGGPDPDGWNVEAVNHSR